ncbi:MAG: hypothetical protein ACLUKO_11705 [Enterocloster bolteae]
MDQGRRLRSGTGSSLTKGAKTGDFAAVTAKAQEFVAAVAAARA